VITAFKDTLAPAALVGLAFTTCGVFLSGWVGGLVDRTKRLVFVRSVIGVQKVSPFKHSTHKDANAEWKIDSADCKLHLVAWWVSIFFVP